MQPIRLPLRPPAPPLPPAPPQPNIGGTAGIGGTAAVDGGNPFVDMVFGKVQEVNSAQRGAEQMIHQMLTGEDVNQAEVLTAVQKADMAFRMMLQMRNKLMDAYREVQQIQI